MCSGGGNTPKAPDLSAQTAEIERNNAWARDTVNKDIAFRQGVYDQSKPQQQRLYDMASQVAAQQLGHAGDLGAAGKQQLDMYRGTYMPIEQRQALMSQGGLEMGDGNLAALASSLGIDPAQAAQMMALSRGAMETRAQQGMTQAKAASNNAFAQQARNLTRMGGDPARITAAAAQLANQQALAGVGAANQGRAQARGELFQNTANTANFGRNALGAAGQMYGLSGNLGTSGLANQNIGFMSGLPYAQFASGGVGNVLGAAGLGNQASLGVGGLMNQQYKDSFDPGNESLWPSLIAGGAQLGAAYLTSNPMLAAQGVSTSLKGLKK